MGVLDDLKGLQSAHTRKRLLRLCNDKSRNIKVIDNIYFKEASQNYDKQKETLSVT